jgi:hypothetical protein
MSCCKDSCGNEVYAHRMCVYHSWSESCSRGLCSNPATHSWAGEETALPGDVCFFCDQHWQEFVADEAEGGAFAGSLGSHCGSMHHIYLR